MNFHIHGDARLKTGKCLRMHNDCRGGFYFSLAARSSPPRRGATFPNCVRGLPRPHVAPSISIPSYALYVRVYSFSRRVAESGRTVHTQENRKGTNISSRQLLFAVCAVPFSTWNVEMNFSLARVSKDFPSIRPRFAACWLQPVLACSLKHRVNRLSLSLSLSRSFE